MHTPSSHLLPKQPCILCLTPSFHSLCPACQQHLPLIDSPCRQCGLPLANQDDALCGDCVQHPKLFQRTLSPLLYRPPVDHLIHLYKQKSPAVLISILAAPLLTQAQKGIQAGATPKYLIPTPSHWQRKFLRAFNPAQYLAEHLSRELRIPLLNALHQPQLRASQKKLTKQQRQKNLGTAFALLPRYQSELAGSYVVVVDDVITTGATAQALTQTLLNAGVARVAIWALARTPKPTAL